MRRTPTAPLALLAGLALFLSGCAGETPTSPGTGGGGGSTGGCAASVSLTASSLTPQAGSIVGVRATAMRSGQPVPDGTSIFFTTDLGFFVENGLQNISKTTTGGVADVGVVSTGAGTARVRATLDCAAANLGIVFQAVQTSGPFISSIQPASGSCAGGQQVTINGGKFAGTPSTVRVLFGGSPATVVSVAESAIVVTTPARALANPQVPEDVDVVVLLPGSSTPVEKKKGFRYACVDPNKRIFISSINPNSGSPDGGETVIINGQNFGNNASTTRVQFGGANASVVSVSDTSISVLTPRRVLANPNVPETVDVSVEVDLGLVSQQLAPLAQGFTYRAGLGTVCNTSSPNLFIATITPNTGNPAGGEVVSITGGGYGTDVTKVRVEFVRGSVSRPGVVLGVSGSSLSVSTPQWVLANPDFAENVDVRVTSDLGGPKQACVTSVGGFTFTRLALEPSIFSSDPKTGPNDASTRVTIFGAGFQFPMQVFLTGGGCGATRIGASVVSIRQDQIVFLTPIARNGNVCLANQLVDIEIVNPQTNKRATCPQCFKYYDCPTISGIEPGFGSYFRGTTVTISGSNFEENVTVSAGNTAWSVVSVSSSQIVAIANPPVLNGCSDIVGPVTVTSLALNCPPAISTAQWTYQVASIRPVITSVSPSPTPQAGGAVITIRGRNFFDNLRVEVGGNRVNFILLDSQTITFVAPVFNGPFRQVPCTTGGGAPGVQNADTDVPLRVVNLTTTCDGTDFLTYTPANTTCAAPLTVTGSFAAGTFCTPYAGGVGATGGMPPYIFSATGLPNGLTMTPATGAVTGTPTRTPPPGPGQASNVFSVSVTVTDSLSASATRTIPLAVTDPGAPLTVTGPTSVSIAAQPVTATATGGNLPLTWSITSAGGTGCTINGASGAISACTTAGSITIQAVDTTCAPTHAATRVVTITP